VLDRAWRLAAGAAAAVVGSVTELAELAGAVCSGATSAIGLVRASAEEVVNPIAPTLGAGTGVSAAAGSLIDPVLITTVLAVNALIGGVQRVSAQKSLRSLVRSNASRVHVRRSRADSALRADQLVEGDVIRLQAGDAVPADCRVLSGRDLEIDESTLTGESVPVAKSARATGARALADRNSMLYEGTVVAAGSGEAVVVATGTAPRRPHPAPGQRRGARDRGRDPDPQADGPDPDDNTVRIRDAGPVAVTTLDMLGPVSAVGVALDGTLCAAAGCALCTFATRA
jgi:hypothetical protein